MAKGRGKANNVRQHPNQTTMRIVTADTCMACKQQCARGLAYLEKMSRAGAIGFGVPCVLTLQKYQNTK